MPFIARKRSTGERVDITRLREPRAVLDGDDLACQLCGARMMVKAGMIVRAHFAHYAECGSDLAAHPESSEHRLGKLLIAERLRRELTEYTGVTIEYEVPIPEAKRVADVLVTFPNGWRIAHECQLAGQSPVQLANRTEDYLRAGVDVVWWLGKSAATGANRQWCVDTFGFALELDYADLQAQHHHDEDRPTVHLDAGAGSRNGSAASVGARH